MIDIVKEIENKTIFFYTFINHSYNKRISISLSIIDEKTIRFLIIDEWTKLLTTTGIRRRDEHNKRRSGENAD